MRPPHSHALLLCLAAACSTSEPAALPPDPDASIADAGGPDASMAPPDAGPADAGLVPADAGRLPGAVVRARSLVWTQPAIVEDPTFVSLASVMAAAADDGHGGDLFDWMLRRFGTTPHSQRSDQTRMADELKMTLGVDPASWDLSQAPFIVTAVHNRIDLAADGHCGELRVSLATTHATIQPFHLIFLFRMQPEAGDADCRGLAIRLARLSELAEPDFLLAAEALLAEHVAPARFILLETAEFTFAPWEWRQWTRIPNPDPTTSARLPFVLENPPLFQTVDVEGLNPAGPRRDAFLQWVEANARQIDRRRTLIPEQFRPRHAIAPTAFPRQRLSLTGLNPNVLAAYPDLRKKLEIVGCPACHTTEADFVQTTALREFSDFYDRELDARADALDRWVLGTAPSVPFGPLQPNPVLPD